MKIINVTPHPLNFQAADGSLVEVPASGILINARPMEEAGGVHACGATLVRTRFAADAVSETALSALERENPGAAIVGSIIAAQTFPGRVLAMVPAPGFERVPPEQKKMRMDKFATF